MRALVTGATGLIGSRLTRRLSLNGHEVSVLVRKESNTVDIDQFGVEKKYGDITVEGSLYPSLSDIDVVFHCAGLVKQWKGFSSSLHNINVLGARNVFTACLKARVKRVVAVSSAVTIGLTKKPEVIDESNPFQFHHMPYAKSKWLLEKEAEKVYQKGLDMVIVNPVTVFGAGDRHQNAGRTLMSSAEGKYFGYPPGGTTVVDVEDVVDGILASSETGKTGERYILGNEHISFFDLLTTISEIVNSSPPKIKLPGILINSVAIMKELLASISGNEPYPSIASADMSVKYMYCSSGKASKDFGFAPKISFKQSLKNAYDWYLKKGLIIAK